MVQRVNYTGRFKATLKGTGFEGARKMSQRAAKNRHSPLTCVMRAFT